jgi:hypothetical protein
MSVRHCEHQDLLSKIAIDNAEGELMEDKSAAGRKTDRPTFGSFRDGGYSPLELVLKI